MWTNQHGTGPKTDDMVDTQVILQYMCQDFPEERFPDGKMTSASKDFQLHTIRNGVTKTQNGYHPSYPETSYVSTSYGVHEPYYYYNTYYTRERNKGELIKDRLDSIKVIAEEAENNWSKTYIAERFENSFQCCENHCEKCKVRILPYTTITATKQSSLKKKKFFAGYVILGSFLRQQICETLIVEKLHWQNISHAV